MRECVCLCFLIVQHFIIIHNVFALWTYIVLDYKWTLMLLCQNCHLLRAEVLLHCSVHLDHVQLSCWEEGELGRRRIAAWHTLWQIWKSNQPIRGWLLWMQRVEAPLRYWVGWGSGRTERRNHYVLTAIQRRTQRCTAWQTRRHQDHCKHMEGMFNRLGAPEVIHRNQGETFESCVFATVCDGCDDICLVWGAVVVDFLHVF